MAHEGFEGQLTWVASREGRILRQLIMSAAEGVEREEVLCDDG